MIGYFGDMTLKEIGKLVGVTESRTSQVVAEQLVKLRKNFIIKEFAA